MLQEGQSQFDDTPVAPYVAPPSSEPKYFLQKLNFKDPFRWLSLGWQDMRSHGGIAVFYGLCFCVMAVVLRIVFRSNPEYTMSIASGCLLVGPFLAMGLYEVSRRRELGLVPDLASSLTCWDRHISSMGMLVLVLIVLELLWGRASLVVFAVFFNTATLPDSNSAIQALLDPKNLEFVLVYACVGGMFALLVYAFAVVSIPMIRDRDTDAISAAIASFQVVFTNLPVMLFWGLIITCMVMLSLWPWGFGLLLIGPWLGHASWHAYRGAISWPAPLDGRTEEVGNG